MLLGAAVGPNGLDLFDQQSFHKLGPLVVIGLGWLGFFFGTNLEARTLRKFPRKLYLGAMLQSLVTFCVVLGVALAVLSQIEPLSSKRWIAAVILAATAAGTAPSSLFMLGSERLAEGPDFEATRFFATVDDLPGLIALGILCSFSPSLHGAAISNPLFWFVVQSALGVVYGFFLHFLKLQDLDESAGDLVVFGLIGMSSGMCLYLHLSPLYVCALTGMVVVNVSDRSERIYERVASREHAFYVLFLLLAGCLWDLATLPLVWLLAAALLYAGVRLLGKLVGGALASAYLAGDVPISSYNGLGLISQGGLAVAMVVSYRWAFVKFLEDWVVSVVLLCVVLHELLAPWLEVRLFGAKKRS